MTGIFLYKPEKMGQIVIYNCINVIGSEFKLDQQGPGHKGLIKFHKIFNIKHIDMI